MMIRFSLLLALVGLAACSAPNEDLQQWMQNTRNEAKAKVKKPELPELPLVPADRLMLEQVLLNLMRNGMEAMADNAEADRLLRVAIEISDEMLTVSVADQGCGIAPENRDKLFTAFFTTKPDGMGIGLSICRSIIEFHRGRLWAEDNPRSATGRGTIFIFTLPLQSP